MQQSAKEEMTVSTLARQSLRAFITADNLSLGHQRIRFLLDQYQEIENKGGFESFVNSDSIELWINEDNAKEIALFKEKKKTLVGVNKYSTKENGKKYSIEKEL